MIDIKYRARVFDQSRTLLSRAREVIAGGVTSAARAGTQPVPLYIESASGARIVDVDGNSYIDYVMGFGPLLLGHAPKEVIDSVSAQLHRGWLYGSQHRAETEVARLILDSIPAAEQVVFTNTGSEAVHVALRLARASTERDVIVQFEGHYHGWLENVSYCTPGQAPLDPTAVPYRPHIPATRGISPTRADLLILPWNDLEALRRAFSDHGNRIAAVIMEPVPQAGVIEPKVEFLAAVRELSARHRAFLILDEVVTGFRLGRAGAAGRYGIEPDLIVLGKALGAGFPVAAVVGPRERLEEVASGRLAHMGTFNGHCVNFAAARAALESYARPEFYQRLEVTSAALATGLRKHIAAANVPLKISQVGALLHVMGLPEETTLRHYGDLRRADSEIVRRFAQRLLLAGIHIQARGTLMVCAAHSMADVAETLDAAAWALKQ